MTEERKLVDEIDSKLFKDFTEVEEEDIMELLDSYNSSTVSIELPGAILNEGTEKRFKALLSAKGPLIRKALNVETLSYFRDGDSIVFPWFDSDTSAEELNIYRLFIVNMINFALHAKRISSEYHEPENEKYAFRCFLLRLGYIGSVYKTDRKVLLRNLKGSSAFRSEK